jgi:hypothetical protein
LNQPRQGSESNAVFTDCQPQYPDLQGDFNADFTGLQEVSDTIRRLPDLTRHVHSAYSVIEEIVEGFVEGSSSSFDSTNVLTLLTATADRPGHISLRELGFVA